jgi:hypothetical protein
MNIKKAESIISQVSSVIENWNGYTERTKVETALKESIAKTLILL